MQPKETIIQDEPEYFAKLVSYENGAVPMVMMHLDVKIWTPRAFKKLLKSWTIFRKTIRGPLFALSNGEKDETWEKFVTRLGFEFFMDVKCPDGVTRPCFISEDPQYG